MTAMDVDQLKGHIDSAVHGIFVFKRRAKLDATTKGNEFELSAMRAGISGTTKRKTPQLIILSIFSISVSLG